MTFLARQLILTLAYSAQFDFPLTTREVWQRLLAPSGGHWGSERYLTVVNALWKLAERGLIERVGRYWVLRGCESAVSLRERRHRLTEHKLTELRPLLWLCSLLPCVWGVVMTGSAAADNADEHHDVDFLIVPQPQSLWLLRPVIVFFALLSGKRRSWKHEEPNSWCFNLWLEPAVFGSEAQVRTRYLAYEILQMQWLLVRGETQTHFFGANKWLAQMLPNAWNWLASGQPRRKRWLWEWQIYFRPLVSLLNRAAYWAQRSYMFAHQTTERVSYRAAFFHPRDTRGQLMAGWRQAIERWASGRQPTVLVTGVFDILHQEHLEFLRKAARLGQLVVGVESDKRVRQIKGEGRPINTQADRVRHLKETGLVNQVFVLPETFSSPDDHRRLLRELAPDVLAVSSHTAHLEAKTQLMKEIGGRVEVVHQHNPSVSTTQLLRSGWTRENDRGKK